MWRFLSKILRFLLRNTISGSDGSGKRANTRGNIACLGGGGAEQAPAASK